LTSLKSSDSVSFSTASAEVDVASIVSPPAVAVDNKAQTLTGGAIAGIIIAGVLLAGAGIVYYAYFCRPIKEDGSKVDSSSSPSSSSSSSLFDTNDTNVPQNFATANPMQVHAKKSLRAEFEPTSSDGNV